jgi:hypothetical protein
VKNVIMIISGLLRKGHNGPIAVDGTAIAWWLPHTLQKHYRIIAAVNAKELLGY